MTPWQNRVTAMTRRMADDMKLRNCSQSTIDADTYHVGRFVQFLGRSPDAASPEDVRSFQLHLIECVSNIKHRTFLLTLSSAGLRLNEAAKLTIADIDSRRRLSHPDRRPPARR